MVQRGIRTLPNVRARIEELANEAHGAQQIADKLVLEVGDHAVSAKTVRAHLKERKALNDAAAPVKGGTEDQAPWSLRDADPAEAALVLPVIGALDRAQGADWRINKATAHWIARVRMAAPSIPLLDAFRIAVRYRAELAAAAAVTPLADQQGDRPGEAPATPPLRPHWPDPDLFLALELWRDDDENRLISNRLR